MLSVLTNNQNHAYASASSLPPKTFPHLSTQRSLCKAGQVFPSHYMHQARIVFLPALCHIYVVAPISVKKKFPHKIFRCFTFFCLLLTLKSEISRRVTATASPRVGVPVLQFSSRWMYRYVKKTKVRLRNPAL